MKTTKMRKRMLVSSLAMLLVAMVALGSATYAWFTSSTTATAKGLNVQTIQASELVISDYTKGWGTEVNYNVVNKVLMPTSTANGTAWFKANAESKTSYAIKSTDKFTGADAPKMHQPTSSSYALLDQLNVKNEGAATVQNVKIKFSVPAVTNANYLRVALVPANADGSLKGTFADCVYDADGADYQAVSGETTTVKITPEATGEVEVGTLAQNEAAYYNLYVWFEGQDTACFDGNAGQIIPDIEFTVTGDTVVSTEPVTMPSTEPTGE